MTCGIYKLLSEDNECLWIGQSVNIENRFKAHRFRLLNELHREGFVEWFISKDKEISSVKLEILEECEPSLLNEREGFWFLKNPPKFFGQIPSVSRKWYLSDEAKKNISEGQKRSIAKQKAAGTFKDVRKNMIALKGEEYVREQLRSIAFNSETAAAAGRKGAGRPNTEEQKLRQSEAARNNAANILICDVCDRPCKGKSALGAHKRTHRSELVA